MTKRVAELRRFSSNNLLGLLGALLRTAVPSVDLVDHLKIHLMIWAWLQGAVAQYILQLHLVAGPYTAKQAHFKKN